MTQVGTQRRGVHSSMAYLAGLIAANLSSWQEYDKAMLWYREALDRAGRAGDRAATGWIAARSTLLAVRRGDHRRVKHQAPTRWPSPRQASWGPPSATRWPRRPPRGWDHREVALMALRDAERATEYAGEETFTAYSCPWYRVGRFASEALRAPDCPRGSLGQSHCRRVPLARTSAAPPRPQLRSGSPTRCRCPSACR